MSDKDTIQSLNINISGVEAAVSTAEPKSGVRPNLAAYFLNSAAKASLRANEIWKVNRKAEHGPWFEEMLNNVPSAVIMSAAAVEAHVNEAIQDHLDKAIRAYDIKAKQGVLDDDLNKKEKKKNLLQALKEDRGENTLEKCKSLRKILDAPEKTKINWNQVNLLMEFRNSLIHFRPAWNHDTLTDKDLKNKLAESKIPIYEPCRDQFPLSFMTYGTSKWAVRTALKFISDLAPVLDFRNRFEGKDYKLP